MSAGDSIIAENANWSFGGNVSKSFDKHVCRSVPLYHEGHDLVAKISDFFLQKNSICYDLGCSTGKLIQILNDRSKKKKIRFIGIDNENGMVKEAREKSKNKKNVILKKSDLIDVEFEKADLIISYYTMQFVKPKNRQLLFDRIYESLNWGGGFLLFEKVRAPDARFQDMMTAIYTDYKIDRGYNADEIVTKTRSLKGVLEPFSTQGNLDLMKRAGFVDIMTVMQYVCFEGFLAIK
ncbi:MAG: methyltransferase domain-containing protein [Candidatus Brocadiaceae bacterium]|nr:methyltransferase domain-containing protein [Candidatus Brocadiaceae bacterium]